MDKELLARLAKIERQATNFRGRKKPVEARVTRNGDSLRLYGVVGDPWDGVTDESVAEALDEIEAGDLDVRVNSPGGLVFMGMAIYQLLRERNVTFTVDGLAASIMSVIIMAGKVRVHRGSQIMIHNPLMLTIGDEAAHEKSAEILRKTKDSIIAVYQAKTGQEPEILEEMMDEETWLTAEEAVEWGFADELIDDESVSPAENISNLDLSILRAKYPEQVAAMSRTAPNPKEETTMEPKTDPKASGKQTPDPENKATSQADQERDAAVAQAREQAVAEERQRIAAIRNVVATAKLEDEFAQKLIDEGKTIDQAREAVINKWAENGPQLSGQHKVEITRDETDTRVAAISKALMHRYRPSDKDNAIGGDDPARQYAGLNLREIARAVCDAHNISTQGFSPARLAMAALSTSDFPLITENVISKTLRSGYDLAPRTFVPLATQSTMPDFKEKSVVQLGEAPQLQKVLEGGEYQHGSIGEAAEKYRLFKYGKIVPITWETIVNDDLDAFTRIPRLMGQAAGQLESDLFWAHFTGNPTMHDSTALFHADHGNLASSGGALSIDNIGEGRTAMRKQTGLDGKTRINVMPEFLVVPAALETKAEQFVSTNFRAEQSGNINPFAGRLQVISEPRLDSNSETAWYLWASPNAIETIEYAYLEGEIGPVVETDMGFERDGIATKIRHCFGVKALDWRGLYKNAGA